MCLQKNDKIFDISKHLEAQGFKANFFSEDKVYCHYYCEKVVLNKEDW